MASPIKVDGVSLPGDNMDPGAIDAAAGSIRTVGSNVSSTGTKVQTSWQTLSASYQAPEQDKLFTAMTPATNQAAFFATDMDLAATALETFATEVRAVKAAVAKIKSDAESFLSTITNGQVTVPITGPETRFATKSTKQEDWDSDQGRVDTNNGLIHRMNDQQEALWAAERACANSLNAISGAAPIGAADPKTGKGGYGYTDLPDNAKMPWGSSVSRKEDCGERMVKGFFVDGLFNGLVQGVTSLVGFSWSGPGGVGFSWSTFGHAWEGVAKLGTALSPTNAVLALVPGPIGDWSRSSQKALTQTVTGLVGIDPYAKDPFAAWHHDAARTFGSSLFNVASIVVPETKVGDVGKAGEVGRVADGTSKVARVIDVVSDGAKWVKGITLDGLSKITSKLGDFGKTFKFGDDITIPKVGRDDVGTGHTNLGGHDHTDAPPPRSDTNAGHGSGDHGTADHGTADHGTADHGTSDHGTSDHGTGDHGTGDHGHPGTGDGSKESPRVYEYHNRAEGLRAEHQPSATEVNDIGPARDYQPGTHDHMVSRWHDYEARGGTQSWDRWRDGYIRNQGQAARGAAYEQAFWDDKHFSGDEWSRNTSMQDATGVNRNYDIVNQADQSAYELKSGNSIDPAQLVKDRQLVRAGWDVKYVFGKEPSASVIEKLHQAGVSFEVFHGDPVVVP